MKLNKELIKSFEDLKEKGIEFHRFPVYHTVNFLCNPLIWNRFRSFSTTSTGIVTPDIMSFMKCTNMHLIENKGKFKDAYLSLSRLYKNILFGNLMYKDVLTIFSRYFSKMTPPRYVDIAKGDFTLSDEERGFLFARIPDFTGDLGSTPPSLMRILMDAHLTKIAPIISEDSENIEKKSDFKEIIYKVGEGDNIISIPQYYMPDLADFAMVSSKNPILVATVLNLLELVESPFIFLDMERHLNASTLKKDTGATYKYERGGESFKKSKIYEGCLKNRFRPIMPALMRLIKERGMFDCMDFIESVNTVVKSAEYNNYLNNNPSGDMYEIPREALTAFLLLIAYRSYAETTKLYRSSIRRHEDNILSNMLISDTNFLIQEDPLKRKKKVSEESPKLRKKLPYFNKSLTVSLSRDLIVPVAEILLVGEE